MTTSHAVSLALAALAACGTTDPPATPTCETYGVPATVGHLGDPELLEASGLAASRVHPGVWYSHNDSGSKGLIYAFRSDGTPVGKWELPGIAASDFEDLAAGPCPGGGACLYVGDTGDNTASRTAVDLHVVREPAALDATAITVVSSTHFTFEGGPRDCEALFVHPTTGDVYFVDKFAAGGPLESRGVSVLRAAELGADAIAKSLARVAIPEAQDSLITAADLSPDGTRLVIRSYAALLEYRLPAGRPFEELFAQAPEILPDIFSGGEMEYQGEAVAYALDGQSVWTTSEGNGAPINRRSCEP